MPMDLNSCKAAIISTSTKFYGISEKNKIIALYIYANRLTSKRLTISKSSVYSIAQLKV